MNKKLLIVISTIVFYVHVSYAQIPVSKGEKLVRQGNCIGCHTTNQDGQYAGGVALASPIGVIYSTNITPDKQTGIGNYSYEDFDQAVRHGKTKKGYTLYPAMPFDLYAKLSDEDVHSLYEYFMHEVKPIYHENLSNNIDWPLSMRWPLAIWRKLYANSTAFSDDDSQSEAYNRGAYLVESLGHCGTCHTPRNFALALKGTDPTAQIYLSGASLSGWYAPDLRRLNSLDEKELFSLLKNGYSETRVFSGPMEEVSEQSLKHLSDQDIKSMITYLRAIALPEDTKLIKITNNKYNQGEVLYNNYCSTCHGLDGRGIDNVIPRLQSIIQHQDEKKNNLINVVLHGGKSDDRRSQIGYIMPAYKYSLNNQEISDIINYIIDKPQWNNYGKAITAKDIAKVRQGNTPMKGWWFILSGIVLLIICLCIVYKILKKKKA